MERIKKELEIVRATKILLALLVLLIVSAGVFKYTYPPKSDADSFGSYFAHEAAKNLIVGSVVSALLTWFVRRELMKDRANKRELIDEAIGCADAVKKSLTKLGIDAIHVPPEESKQAMVDAMKAERNEILVIGVSLKFLLDLREGILRPALKDNPHVKKVRILIHNLDCKSARKRSYSEYCYELHRDNNTPKSWQDFSVDKALIKRQTNWRHIWNGIESARRLSSDKPQVEARIYHSDAQMFMLMTLKLAFVEPLHYGKEDSKNTLLSGKMPMLVFRNPAGAGKSVPPHGAHNNYEELKAHFNFVWNNYSDVLPATEPEPSDNCL